MEWVETTGKTVEEAKEAALDQLGVDEQEAEFEIIEEPKSGLFGRIRREARVRARVQPKKPRPKADRRDRRRKGPKDGKGPKEGDRRNGGSKSAGGRSNGGAKPRAGKGKPEPPGKQGDKAAGSNQAAAGRGLKPDAQPRSRGGNGGERAETAPQPVGGAVVTEVEPEPTAAHEPRHDRNPRDEQAVPAGEPQAEGDQVSSETVSMDEQATIIEEFLEGLVDAFGVEADLRREDVDDDLLEVQVDAPDLGLMIGPKGQTLSAIQELSRTVLQRKATGVYEGRVRIDIGGYRNRRRAALERFATSVAEQVRSSGTQKVLEPMNPADRKVVHDTINELDGVATSSEGTEPYRRVVIRPAD